jgi:hypothetical protein
LLFAFGVVFAPYRGSGSIHAPEKDATEAGGFSRGCSSVNPAHPQTSRNPLQNNTFQPILNLHTIKSKKRILE